ncbi:unnamed protein product [Schistocephalus solidus]|uniref:Sorbin and SH3 domain-containing protein 1 n=1 Tax=Schistocephalus solidus TaxID=70667 RepID=A0A183TTY7_SCHSO|nr:unnamed protein product [Schistocephalus solidus]
MAAFPPLTDLTNQVEPQFPAVSCSSPSPSPPNLSPTITETAEVNGNDRKSVLSSAGQSPPVPERFQEEAPFQSTEDVKVQQEPTERSPVNEDEPSEAMTHAQVMRLVKQQKMQSFDEGSIRDPPMQSQSCPQYTSSRSTDRESRVSASSAEAEQSRRTDTRKVAQVPTSSISSRSPSPSSSLSSHTSQPSVVHLRPEAVEAGTSQQIPVSVTVHPGAVLPSEPINYDVVDTGPSSSSNSSSSSPKTSPEPSPRARPALTPILRPRAVDRGSTNTASLTTKSLQPFRAHDQENTTNSSSQWNPYAPIAFADDSDSSAATRTKGQNALVSEQTPTTSSNLYFPYLSRVSIITDSRSTLAPLFVSTDSSYPRAPEAPRASGPLLSFSPSSYSTAPEEALPFALASSSHNETAFTSSGEPSVVYTNPITYMPLLTKPPLAAGSDKPHLPETTLHRATLLDKLEKPSPAYRLTSITPVSSVTQSSSSSNISCLLPYQSFIYSRAEGNAGLGGADIGNSRCTQVASSLSQTTNTISAVRENDRLSGSLPSRGPLFSFITGASGVNDSQEEYKRSPMPPPPPPPLTSARIDNSLLLRHGYTPYRALENHPPDLSTSLPEGTLSRFYSSVALSQQRKLPTGVAAVHEKKVFADEPEIMPEELFPLDVVRWFLFCWWYAQGRLRPGQPPAPSLISGLLDLVTTPGSGVGGGGESAIDAAQVYYHS